MAAILTTTYLTPASNLKLVKTFKANGEVEAYPNAKSLTSHEKQYPLTKKGMLARLQDMREFADQGGCLLRGNMKTQIVNESRAGKTDVTAPNQTLMLDFDKVGFDCSRFLKETTVGKLVGKKTEIVEADIVAVAEEMLTYIGAPSDVSYFAHASNSLGMKHNKISIHIEFIMEAPVATTKQKEWLEFMNFASPQLSDNVGLSRNKMALTMPLDPTVAHNTKLIYIGNPRFEKADMNPVKCNRILFVEKEKLLLDSGFVTNVDGSKLHAAKEKALDARRQAEGLKRFAIKTKHLRIGRESVQVYTNSERLSLDIAYEQGDFVYCNVNGGDSHAYYFMKRDPTLMLNFKNEPAFKIKDANPDFFDMVCELYKEEMAKNAGGQFFLRRRKGDKGTIFGIILDADSKEVITHEELPDTATEDWCEHFGILRPDAIPFANIFFDPTGPAGKETLVEGNVVTDQINIYSEPESIKKRSKVDFVMTYEDSLEHLAEHCPATYLLLMHVCANDTVMCRHFVNWLAVGAQTRDKTQTTFLFQGTQGTGKGLLFDHIMKPLFGAQYSAQVNLEALEEKFTGYLESTLILLIDEFRHGDSQASKFLENKLKLFVTEKVMPLRKMQHDVDPKCRTYFNTVFFSNNRDAIRIPEGDRRINVCPRQEIKLRSIFKKDSQRDQMAAIGEMIASIDQESPAFVGAMMQMQADASAARLVIENEAKTLMQHASRTKIEDFQSAIEAGTISYFVDTAAAVTEPQQRQEVQIALGAIVQSYEAQMSQDTGSALVPVAALAPFYGLAADVRGGNPAFHMQKWMARHQLTPVQGSLRMKWKRDDLTAQRVIEVNTRRAASKVVTPIGGPLK